MPNVDEMIAAEALLRLPYCMVRTSPVLFVKPNKQETIDTYWDGQSLHVPVHVLSMHPNPSNYQNIVFLKRNVPQQVVLKILNGCPFLFPKSINMKTSSTKRVRKNKEKIIKESIQKTQKAQKSQYFSNYPRCSDGQSCKISGMEAFSYFKNSKCVPFLLRCISCSKYIHPCCAENVKGMSTDKLKDKSFRFKCDICS